MHTRSAAASGTPFTATCAVAASVGLSGSRITRPSTLTRPSRIHASARLREHTPSLDSTRARPWWGDVFRPLVALAVVGLRRLRMLASARDSKKKSPACAGLFVLPIGADGNRRSILLLLLLLLTLGSVLALHHQLDATVALTASRGLVGVDRVRLAEALHRSDAVGRDSVRGQITINDVGTTIGQTLVVRIGADRVGVAVDLDLDLGITVQRIHSLVEDGHRIGFRRFQGRADVGLALLRTVELEVHAAQVNDHVLRAAVRTDDRAGSGVRALVVAVVDAIVVAVHRRAVGRRRSSRGRRRRRGMTHLDDQANGGETIHPGGLADRATELVLTRRGGEASQTRGRSIAVIARGQFATQRDTIIDVVQDTHAQCRHRTPSITGALQAAGFIAAT